MITICERRIWTQRITNSTTQQQIATLGAAEIAICGTTNSQTKRLTDSPTQKLKN